jgi:hypothetical protein
MRVADLLEAMQARGVELSAAEGRLRVEAPIGVLSESDWAELAACKAELLPLLAPTAVELTPRRWTDEQLPEARALMRACVDLLERLRGVPDWTIEALAGQIQDAEDSRDLSRLRAIVERLRGLAARGSRGGVA